MNDFSDKEYQNLKTDTAEVRSCITRYIGYIITVTGFSGFIKFYFDENIGPTGVLTMFFISLLVLTLLFEVLWYKFKSHNRMVGYMQLLMQEVNAIPYELIAKKKHWRKKKYVQVWKEYSREPGDKNLKNFFSWEFVMSRLNSNAVFSKKSSNEIEIAAYTAAANKCKYIFSLPERWNTYVEMNDCEDINGNKCDRDVDFLQKIVLPIYSEKNGLPIFGKNFGNYFRFLFGDKLNSKPLKEISIENRYLVYGWEYPRKVTQIAFIAILLIYCFFIYFLIKNFYWANPIRAIESLSFLSATRVLLEISLPFILFILSSTITYFWFKRYMLQLKELLYGKFSIDYYCWQFFIYRIQLLNSKNLVPVIYSRSYLRYFKSKTYQKIIAINKDDINEITKNYLESTIKNYELHLKDFLDFSDNEKLSTFHSSLVASFKKMKESPKIRNKYKIPKRILQENFNIN